MAHVKIDDLREHRIDTVVVLHAYGGQERAIGWYTYLQDKLAFPFAGGPGPPLKRFALDHEVFTQ
jgi:hypothetical protein